MAYFSKVRYGVNSSSIPLTIPINSSQLVGRKRTGEEEAEKDEEREEGGGGLGVGRWRRGRGKQKRG